MSAIVKVRSSEKDVTHSAGAQTFGYTLVGRFGCHPGQFDCPVGLSLSIYLTSIIMLLASTQYHIILKEKY